MTISSASEVVGDLGQAFEGQTSLGPSSKKKKGPASGKKPGKKDKAGGDSNLALASIGGKDPTLDLFHAMGKVLYCKRDEEDLVNIQEFLGLIFHLISQTRPRFKGAKFLISCPVPACHN